ncbi:beta-L-arabinofuranosidase domain-containing protein [Ereboglobus luteus]|uniref:DUF1680 family protein n=1 Tax=Ereboglobus luteus TaxID=1796921 RepID=A0A2U8E685_9BACT|nr:beta-L-arabinofuranosidase domain-containing protein [Ereboglobus luteus]AWI10449.1 hypothetical protein CKA38_01775 [Ereboglobus luteus]
MPRPLVSSILAACLFSSALAASPAPLNNRAPLVQKPYVEMPLGSIKAKGWLQEMLLRQKSGATGQMDTLYPQVMGPRNGWLGGDGDQWERGPYWIDGLLPLAYLLDDQALKDKVRPWIEWALASQREDGYFGPATDYAAEFGLQRNNSADWWPRMVVLKILQQHYSATGDERVPPFMTKYFQYQLKTLPNYPLGRWTFWAEYRVCDNLQAVYWLYNITGDAFLLDLARLLHRQGVDYTSAFLKGDMLSQVDTIHCVNLAQGIKTPIVYYQQQPEKKHLDAVKKALADIRRFSGQAQGMYGGDEALRGGDPTHGSELCSAVEFMYSLEVMLGITGDTEFADRLERVAFNALPAQIADDFMTKQYFQQANQVMCTRHARNFNVENGGTNLVFGLITGYPCCASNMHQGWPKFTQHLWHATPDRGLAALVYAPSEITAAVADGRRVKITEDTRYPMDDTIRFTVRFADDATGAVAFPLHLRIPGWCENASITVNGAPVFAAPAGGIAVVSRAWSDGDCVELRLPMEVRVSAWYENSVAVERGPLVYALRLTEQWTRKSFPERDTAEFGEEYYEVTTPDKWNYALVSFDRKKPATAFKVEIDPEKQKADYFWNPENAPVQIKARVREIPQWGLYNESAGPIPHSHRNPRPARGPEGGEVTLIPYGCTTLRISQFPVVR